MRVNNKIKIFHPNGIFIENLRLCFKKRLIKYLENAIIPYV